MGSGARWLIVGLDGATWDLVLPLVAEGRMPVLQGLLGVASHARLRSTLPPMTLPAWASILTGANPGRHGIFDFTCRVPGEDRLRFVNSTWRGAPSIFSLLSSRGARVASLAVPGTWPPEPLNGVCLSGFDSPVATRADASFCEPASVWREIMRDFGGFRFADFQEIRIGPGWHEAALGSLLREIGRKEAVARRLLSRERFDAFMMVFGESDTVAHHFWLFADPRSPRHLAAPEPLRDAISAVYSRLDRALGRLLEVAAPEGLCLVSDHGFGGASDIALYLNRYLESTGFLAFENASGRSAPALLETVKGGLLRSLPARAQESLVRALPPSVLGRLESATRWGAIDFSRTRAFSDEMNYAASVHLRTRPEAREALARDVTDALLAWEVEGRRVVERVHLRERLYEGPFVARSADLVLELGLPGGYSYTLLPSSRVASGTTWRRLDPTEWLGGKGKGMNGSHRREGLLLLHGAAFRPDVEVEAGVQDVAPTLLHAMEETVPDSMDGAVRHAALARLRPVPRDDRLSRVAPPPVAHKLTDPRSEADIAGRLRSLGYL